MPQEVVLTNCSISWRVFIYAWKSFDICSLGNGGWSLWSKTFYNYRDCRSFSTHHYYPINIFANKIWMFSPQCLKCLFVCIFFLRVIFNTLFGHSVNFWMAVTTRFLLGSLNGLLGPIKVQFQYCIFLSRGKEVLESWLCSQILTIYLLVRLIQFSKMCKH